MKNVNHDVPWALFVEIDPDLLRPGVHIIAAVEAFDEYHIPSDYAKNSTVVLSAAGSLALYNPNYVTSVLGEFGHVSKLECVELIPKQVYKKKWLWFWKGCLSFSLLFWFLVLILMIWGVIDQFLNGYIPVVSQEFGEGVSAEGVSSTLNETLGLLLVMLPILGAVLYTNFVEGWVSSYVTQMHVKLVFRDGSESKIYGPPEWAMQFWMGQRLALLSVITIIIMSIPPTEFIGIIVPFIVGLMIVLGVYVVLLTIHYFAGEQGYEVGKLNPGHLLRFYQIVKEIHGVGHSLDEVGENDTFSNVDQSVAERVGARIEAPLEEIYAFENELNVLTGGEWEAMLTANKVYFALAHIRRCTEKMLYNLTLINGIKIKPQNRGITTMMNMLTRIDYLEVDVIKWLGIIKAIANPAAHDFEENIDDYLTAFRTFVSLTGWYVNKTAIPVEEE
jgi:hypothetical protein